MTMPSKKRPTKDLLFKPIKIGSVTIKNRFVRSATHEWHCELDGTPKPQLGGLLETLAKGGVGLIITGYAYVNPRGQASKGQNAMYKDELIEPYAHIVDRVHRHGTKIFMQLVHGGRQAEEAQAKYGECLAPSDVPDIVNDMHPRAMTPNEIQGTIEDFVSAARRAKEAGFDGVQLHVAHGFLLSSFISPYTNQRTDEWGGNTENRARIIVEILRGIRDRLGEDFPVIAKMNATDGFTEEGKGLQVGEAADIAKILAAEGLKAIEVSAGIWEAELKSSQTGILDEASEGYLLGYAARIKAEVDIPVISVGGFRSKVVMEAALQDGKCDMVSLSRPLIREPDLVEKFQSGKATLAECISCNKCFDETGIKCHYRMDPEAKKNLPMAIRTSLATVEGGKEMSLPIMMASGPGVMPESAESRGSKGPKKRKPKRRRTAMLKRPLKRMAKRVKKLRSLKGKRLRRPGKKLVRKIRSLRKKKKR
jgi:2,4-dienoyl-CoA reductase-like NADH-dependent reductase (Old Yellow Enzyme family)